ncbi:MAG: 1-acyl-sn-glycerol-3-phosphate acyltransferase [Ilumatobacter sp.]|uniref:1-acyl-sn-glycerol-3-phosphate acyltransferase n=1 Tax=Ilumatobacter sp. TaxID=1967498 RepID=UPI00329A1F3A
MSKYLFGGIRHLASRGWNFEVEGRENVPSDGPAILTPNHLSFCDSIFVPAALPRRVWAIGKGEYMDSWKTKHLFPAMGMIPVDRSGGDAAMAALDAAARVLDAGRLFMIYPEGTRSRSGNLHKGRTGAARLSLRCGAPIVPVGHEGTLEVQPPDSVKMKLGRDVVVRFGRPMWAREFGDVDDPRTLRRFTDAVMFEIAQLSGQTYVDTYAGSSDDASAAVPAGSDDQGRVTPSRPSVVGTAPSARPTVHETVPTTGEPMPIRPPSNRPTVPARRPERSNSGTEVAALRLPPGRRGRVAHDAVRSGAD